MVKLAVTSELLIAAAELTAPLNVLSPAKVCALVVTIPGFVPSAGAKLRELPEILAPLEVEVPETALTDVTPPAAAVAHEAKPFASEVKTFPVPGVPPVIVRVPANLVSPVTCNL